MLMGVTSWELGALRVPLIMVPDNLRLSSCPHDELDSRTPPIVDLCSHVINGAQNSWLWNDQPKRKTFSNKQRPFIIRSSWGKFMTSHAEQGTTEQYRSNRRARRIRKVLLLCPLGKKSAHARRRKKNCTGCRSIKLCTHGAGRERLGVSVTKIFAIIRCRQDWLKCAFERTFLFSDR
jgi:hypothetical protein